MPKALTQEEAESNDMNHDVPGKTQVQKLWGSLVSIMGPVPQTGSIFHVTTQTDLPFGP